MKYRSVFDIIGPVMIGPSSSHTAGAARIGRIARSLLRQEPTWAKVRLYGSFARTYRGHGTDVAIVGGLQGFDPSDPRIRVAFETARESGLEVEIIPDDAPTRHPNTARIQLGNLDESFELVGVSTGGGRVEIVEINRFPIGLSGERPTILVFHRDRPGVIAAVSGIVAQNGINIAHMEVSRQAQGGDALMVVEVDHAVTSRLLEGLSACPFVESVTAMEP